MHFVLLVAWFVRWGSAVVDDGLGVGEGGATVDVLGVAHCVFLQGGSVVDAGVVWCRF